MTHAVINFEYFANCGPNFVLWLCCRLNRLPQCTEWLFSLRFMGMAVCLLDCYGGFLSGMFVLEELRGEEEDAFGLGLCFASTDVHLQSKSGKMMKYEFQSLLEVFLCAKWNANVVNIEAL